MSKLCVVVADQSKARIFTVDDPKGELIPVDELEHPEARIKEKEMLSDRPGRSFDSAGHGRHALGTSVEPSKQEAIRFAKTVAEYLRTAHNEDRCRRLVLVAGPPFLGLLRDNLKSLSGVRIDEIEKNLGQYDAREIRKRLPARL